MEGGGVGGTPPILKRGIRGPILKRKRSGLRSRGFRIKGGEADGLSDDVSA
jgi:hypothetical protein